MPNLTAEQDAFLRAHRLAALATGRRDGSPQLTWIAYEYDGTDIVLQAGLSSAKVRNLGRNDRVSLLVPDGSLNLVVYGAAEVLTSGTERREAIRRVRIAGGREVPDDAALDSELDERGSIAIRIAPERAMGRIEARA